MKVGEKMTFVIQGREIPVPIVKSKKHLFRCPVCHGRKTVKVDYLDVPVPCPACDTGRVSVRLFFRLKGKLITQFFTRILTVIKKVGSAIMETFYGEYARNRYKDSEKNQNDEILVGGRRMGSLGGHFHECRQIKDGDK